MKKIPNVFQRDWKGNRSLVLPVGNQDADVTWLFDGDPHRATIKFDGSAVYFDGERLWVRYDAKLDKGGKPKPFPPVFIQLQERDKAGHLPGWIPAEGNPAARWHLEALANTQRHHWTVEKGTYEAVGPHHQSNPHGFIEDRLVGHGDLDFIDWAFDATGNNFENLHAYAKDFLSKVKFQLQGMKEMSFCEGIVFYRHGHDHRNGENCCKILASDLGLDWKAKNRGEDK